MRTKEWCKKLWRVAKGVFAGVVLATSLGIFVAKLEKELEGKPLTAQEILDRDLGWAKQMSAAGIDHGLTPVRDLFANAHQGAHAFADDALGFESKWKLVTDYVASRDEHAKFLQAQFSTRLFSPEQLEKAVESSVRGYMKHLDDVDSQLLVLLQADLSDLPPEQFGRGIDHGAIGQLLDEAMREARKAAEADFRGTVGREIVSLVAGEVLSAVAVELATSSGILSAGAVSGTVTFGAGLVVGVIADCAVCWAYDKLYDPLGELTKRVNEQMDQVEQMIVVGSSRQPGLQMRLQDYSLRRSKARDAAIAAAILTPEQFVAFRLSNAR
jgi:hypothetical protein